MCNNQQYTIHINYLEEGQALNDPNLEFMSS